MRLVAVEFEDAAIVDIPFAEVEADPRLSIYTVAHGPVVKAIIGAWVTDDMDEDRDLGRAKNPLERSAAA